ncbi:uncharacterized protein isoform X3 [Rhodnius prolixus]|uniref:uncharacterized protein isoform X3 n=1 Tax=Rhodnius prolixus TaxID=13249 RepID=UPI003D18C1E7
MINFNIDKWRDFLEDVAQRPEEVILKMDQYCQNIKKNSQQDKCPKLQKNIKIPTTQAHNISPFLQILNLENPEYRCSARGVYKKPEPSVENLHVCCSAYAKISQTYIDMLGDGKKVRFLQDSNLGPILRMITCVRIKTTEDLKKAFRAFATQRIKRICYFPKEIMNLCVIVITVTENPFCKIAGRLRTIGQPAIRITFSKNELEAERRSISMLIDCKDEPDRLGSFLSLLKTLTGLLRERIIVSHFDLLLKSIFHDTRSLYKTLMKEQVQVEEEPKKPAHAKDYRDGLIEQCKIEIADLKKKLGQKSIQNVFRGLRELSHESNRIIVPNDESTETWAVNRESDALIKQSKSQEHFEKMRNQLPGQNINLSGKQSEIEILEKELERINSDIEIVKKLTNEEKKIMSYNFIEILKYYFNDINKVKKLYFNYGHAKMIENFGVPDLQTCRKLTRECFRWNKRKQEWIMKPMVEKTCRKALEILRARECEFQVSLNIMDAFKMYINWQYEFQTRKRKSTNMSQVDNTSSNCSFHSLCKLLETTYKPQFVWYLNKSKSEVKLVKSAQKLEKILNEMHESVETNKKCSLHIHPMEQFENHTDLIDLNADMYYNEKDRNEVDILDKEDGRNTRMEKLIDTFANTSNESLSTKNNFKRGQKEKVVSKGVIDESNMKEAQMEIKKNNQFEDVENSHNERKSVKKRYVYWEDYNREQYGRLQVLDEVIGQKCLIIEPNSAFTINNKEQPVREYGMEVKNKIKEDEIQPAASHLTDLNVGMSINLSLEHNYEFNCRDEFINYSHKLAKSNEIYCKLCLGRNGEDLQRSSEIDLLYVSSEETKVKSNYENIHNSNLAK